MTSEKFFQTVFQFQLSKPYTFSTLGSLGLTFPVVNPNSVTMLSQNSSFDPVTLRPKSSQMSCTSSLKRARVMSSSSGEKELTGIVTVADLNNRPLRILFYVLMSELESLLLEKIRKEFEDYKFLNCLSEERQKKVKCLYEESRKEKIDISVEQYLLTSYILTIICKTKNHRNQLGCSSKKQAEKQLGSLVDLRNDVMHPHRPLINDKSEVEKLKEKYDTILNHIQRLTQLLY